MPASTSGVSVPPPAASGGGSISPGLDGLDEVLKSLRDAAKSAAADVGDAAGVLKVMRDAAKAVADDIPDVTRAVSDLGRKLSGAIDSGTLGKLDTAAKTLRDVPREAARDVGDISATFRTLGQKIRDALGTGLGAAATGTTALAKAVGVFAASVQGAAFAAIGVGNAMGSFVSKANPAVFAQFELAANDMMAVIGHGLMPVFELVTEVVRMAGDTFVTFARDVGSTFATVLRPVVDVLGVVFDLVGRIGQTLAQAFEAAAPALVAVGEAVKSVVAAIQPILNLLIDAIGGALGTALGWLADVITAIVPYVTAFAKVVGDLIQTVVKWVREALAFVGIELPEGGPGRKEGASAGAATRSASHTDIESVLKAARQNAFSLGNKSGDPAREALDVGKKIHERAQAIYEAILNLPKNIARAILSVGSRAAGAVEEGITDTAKSIDESIGLTRGLRDLGFSDKKLDVSLGEIPGFKELGRFLAGDRDGSGTVR